MMKDKVRVGGRDWNGDKERVRRGGEGGDDRVGTLY